MLDVARTRQCLKEFDFKGLFIEELGWDRHGSTVEVSIDEKSYVLAAVAQKRGMAAFLCSPSDDGRIPDYGTRRKIEKQVTKSVHEHIIIYTDDGRMTQIWQWVKHETGRPTACREHPYHHGQPGDSLIQKLQSVAFSLEEEEGLTLVDVAGRTRAAFDLDRVTKRFYDRFKKEHDLFLKFTDGIPDEELLRWYASVMLNRLMFVYFIQKKGFLGSDQDYLKHKLAESQGNGKDLFYRGLLCPLFFEGFAKKEDERSPDVARMLGKVPYLNGGIFLKHQIEEQHGESIQIPDSAFEKLFDFFDQYQWHLDERPLRADNEINPDVLGYIFEKYINQKQMGAYYTKEDITEYISKNTIIPFLFDAAKQKCRIAFEGEQSVWKLLQSDPDRYIYEAVRKGVDLPLPEEIAVGLNDVSKRTDWNKPARGDYALPTEIWREVVARRTRYEEVKAKALGGEITAINDFITYNLNIRQFAQDVIENCEGPELLRAFYHAIEKVTVLDLTCGSGAFLFAALNILEPLYEACLDRMEVFLEELEGSGEKHRADKYGDFKKILKRIDDHPNRRYFILKSIIINNLFGVDIMEEAVEICKLRLFLKLVAQVDEVEKIEPLPDIDFNIRAGNTLVGFAKLEDVKKALSSQLFSGDVLKRIEEKAEEVDSFFELFRQMQTEHGMDSHDFSDAKEEVGKRLKALEDELNGYLAESYGVDPKKKGDYEKWLSSHKSFHWFVEFHKIMKEGGFNVTIGNPPYVEYAKVRNHYSLLKEFDDFSTNLYACCCFRTGKLKSRGGYASFIVPVSFPSTDRMQPLRDLLSSGHDVFHVSFSTRPSKLFEEAEQRLTIYIQAPSLSSRLLSGGYLKWYAEERQSLFSRLSYVEAGPLRQRHNVWPKVRGNVENAVFTKVFKFPTLSELQVLSGGEVLFYKNTGIRYFSTVTLRAPKCWINGESTASSRETRLATSREAKAALHTLLLSSVFFFCFQCTSNCRDLNPSDIRFFSAPKKLFSESMLSALSDLVERDYVSKGKVLRMQNKLTGLVELESLTPGRSKHLIDEIDRVLAKHYGFTDEELDFIINYDIKYRMGLGGQEPGEE